MRLAVLLSGGGRTLQNLAEVIARGELNARIVLVLGSRPDAHGLVRAAKLNIPTRTVSRKAYSSPGQFSQVVWQHVRAAGADLVALAGFLSLLVIPKDYVGKVINIHPALLPSFGGKGMFGHRLHKDVLAAGCQASGCTVHFAGEKYDTGPIIVQRTCPVLKDDTPDSLAARVFEQECLAYPEAIRLIAAGRVKIEGDRTRILLPEQD